MSKLLGRSSAPFRRLNRICANIFAFTLGFSAITLALAHAWDRPDHLVIVVGNTSPQTGPAAAFGTVSRVIGAYVRKVNEDGGVNGHKIQYIPYDDSYSPPKTVALVRQLVEKDNVTFVFQPFGTPNNHAIHEYLNQQKVPQLFVASGAAKWGDPKNYPWTMGWQPTHQVEARVYARYILKTMPNAKIAILYQDDQFGKEYLAGFKDALGGAAHKLIVLEQNYQVTDPTIGSQIQNFKNAGANVFLNISIPKFAIEALTKAQQIGWNPLHFMNSNSTSVETVLKPAGLDAAKDLLTARYLKEPNDPRWKADTGMREWMAFMKKYYPEGDATDVLNVYGYSVTQTLLHVLRQCGKDFSRQNVMKQAANIKELTLPLLLPGIRINTTPTDFYPIEQMQLARFNGEAWVLFGEVYDGSNKP